MFLVDLILVVIIGLFVLFGFLFGLVHTLGSLIGTILGTVITSRLIDPAFAKFGSFLGGGAIAKIVLFIFIFLVISRLIGLLFWVVEKVLGIFAMVPFAKTFNRLLGAAFGFVEGVIVVGVVLFFALQYLPNDAVRAALEQSNVATYLLAVTAAIQVMYPEGTKLLTK
ncbi:MAG: CvpA family protein [Candidatus Uhrbacteria bacterium]